MQKKQRRHDDRYEPQQPVVMSGQIETAERFSRAGTTHLFPRQEKTDRDY